LTILNPYVIIIIENEKGDNMEIKKVEYIVCLKDDFFMPMTTINRQFCGKLENITDSRFYFRLNGSNAIVIVPHSEIDWMAPSKEFWERGYRKEDI
jgi:hypothetical protein